MKAKCNKRWLGGAKMASPVPLAFLKVGGGEFWVKKMYPSLFFKLSRAGGAHPSELTCIFFFREDTSMRSLRVGVRLLEPPLG